MSDPINPDDAAAQEPATDDAQAPIVDNVPDEVTVNDEPQEFVTASGRTLSVDDNGNTICTDPNGSVRTVEGNVYDVACQVAELFAL